jgi:CheY-like chemotaxis protein
MDAATVAKAFEPFFTTKGVGKGTGLGLSQVYGFARQSGGSVRIHSAPGAGTDVELVLPGSSVAIADEASEAALPGRADAGQGKRVLVVEDEPNVLDITMETLQELGYQTLAATDGRSALDRLALPDQVDLLFSDVVMPGGMSGVELASEARRLRPELKVVLTSGYTGAAGAALPRDIRLLTKPYSRDALSRELESALQG